MTYLITLIVATCSILYELILAQALSIMMGNTVLRYSVTIGLYLFALGMGAMLCDTRSNQGRTPRQRLARVELALSLFGGFALVFLGLTEIVARMGFEHMLFQEHYYGLAYNLPMAAALHIPIVAIGLLSGYEIPLLVAIKNEERPNSLSRILAIDYVGALCGAVLFPLWLLPHWGIYIAMFATAALNGLALLLLSIGYRPRSHLYAVSGLLVLVVMGFGMAKSGALEQLFTRYLYYFQTVYQGDTLDLMRPLRVGDPIERIPSSYQNIDLISYEHVPASIQPTPASDTLKPIMEPDFPKQRILTLNRNVQWNSSTEECYHEPFAHIPIQLSNRVPKRVLIVGGGDGLLARELLKYPQVEAITLVELDPAMIDMARHHPVVSKMNHHSLDDPRVQVVNADAITFLRERGGIYDAVYADFPVPTDSELSRLFSQEFLHVIRAHTHSAGYCVIDVPFWSGAQEWPIIAATARAAGWGKPWIFKEIESDGFFLASLNPHQPLHPETWHDWGVSLYRLKAEMIAPMLQNGAQFAAQLPAAPINRMAQPIIPVPSLQTLVPHW